MKLLDILKSHRVQFLTNGKLVTACKVKQEFFCFQVLRSKYRPKASLQWLRGSVIIAYPDNWIVQTVSWGYYCVWKTGYALLWLYNCYSQLISYFIVDNQSTLKTLSHVLTVTAAILSGDRPGDTYWSSHSAEDCSGRVVRGAAQHCLSSKFQHIFFSLPPKVFKYMYGIWKVIDHS